MRKAYLAGLIAAGSLALGATASASTTTATTASGYTAAAGVGADQAYPAPVGAKVVKKRAGIGAAEAIILVAVIGGATYIALDDDNDNLPDSP